MVQAIVDRAYRRAKDLVQQNIAVLHACADLLMEREQIDGEDLQVCVGGCIYVCVWWGVCRGGLHIGQARASGLHSPHRAAQTLCSAVHVAAHHPYPPTHLHRPPSCCAGAAGGGPGGAVPEE